MKIHLLSVLAGLQCLLSANELPLAVYNPTDSQPKELADKLRPEIYEDVKILIGHLKEPKDSKIIETIAVEIADRKKRAQSVTILTPEVLL